MYKELKGLFIMVLCIFVLGLASGCSTSAIPKLVLPSQGEPYPETINFTWDLQSETIFPEEMLIYKFKERDQSKVKSIFEAQLSQSDRYKLEFSEGGQFIFSDELNKLTPYVDSKEGNYKSLPSEQEATMKAVEYLKTIGFYKPGLQLTQVGQDYVEIFNGDKISIYPINYVITFIQTLNGYPVLGAGVSINIGHNGNIDAVYCQYMEADPHRNVKLISLSKAFDELKQGGGCLVLPEFAVDPTIQKVELAYYEQDSPIAEQPYLQPVYVFSGIADSPHGDVVWQAIVPALRY
jgi:hypothetical protein